MHPEVGVYLHDGNPKFSFGMHPSGQRFKGANSQLITVNGVVGATNSPKKSEKGHGGGVNLQLHGPLAFSIAARSKLIATLEETAPNVFALIPTGETQPRTGIPDSVPDNVQVVVPTKTVFPIESPWKKGKPRPNQTKTARKIVNDADVRTKEREARGLQWIENKWPNSEVEDNRAGAGVDFIVTPLDKRTQFVDIKSDSVMTACEVKYALAVSAEGHVYWIVNPDNNKAMKIDSNCTFEPTQYRVYLGETEVANGPNSD